MTRLTLALASRASASVRERVRRAMASPRPGAVGMCLDLVRDATGMDGRACGGACISGTLGAVVGSTLGAAVGMVGTVIETVVGFLGGTTLGGGCEDLTGSTLGAGLEEGETASGDSSSFHLLKISRSLSIAMSCELMELSVASLIVVERKLMA